MSTSNDTIVAIATAAGEAGLAVVRLSGPGALDVARRLVGPRALPAGDVRSHLARAATLRDGPGGEVLDHGLVLPMLAPRSYTGEDVVEFHCHGGALCARRVARACCNAGARPAGPGEFTRRAFLGGRLSLDQAEAVADLIHAEDELAGRAALRQLRGGLRRDVEAIERPLLDLLARLEGGLEFEGEDAAAVAVPREALLAVLDAALAALAALLADAGAARRVREGVQVVLLGAPNAGKSSLFNALLARERALVDAEPGTTRDVVSARLRHGGVVFVLHDTAGLRTDGGRVEALGMARARAAATTADIVLLLRDLVASEGEADFDGDGVTVVKVATKADLADAAQCSAARAAGYVVTSARDDAGLDELREALLAAAGGERLREVAEIGHAFNERQRHRLAAARDELASLRGEVALRAAPDEVAAGLLAGILAELGEVTGRVFSEHLLGEVFARFCVGK
ncbi:MAG: tRNA uridine-5-carboxymethylaminomethyl(34) synthesis GTPase MnmE [Candidatus Latescibacteria bacterium]|nr:tRNA uridine-5-carboxymethylaminomethyl(34) synthesis GTPase MnmE [Candidatus Latescibacterota bacterium]